MGQWEQNKGELEGGREGECVETFPHPVRVDHKPARACLVSRQ